jgi:hypothetical protein
LSILDNDYLNALYLINEPHTFFVENNSLAGKIIGVNQTGKVIIADDSGNKSEYGFKEIQF